MRVCLCGKAKAWGSRRCLDCEKKRRKLKPRVMHTKSCSHCMKDFQLTTARFNQKQEFCSKKCRNATFAQKRSYALLSRPCASRPFCKVYFPECAQCRRQFAAQLKRTRLCSEGCRKADQVLGNVSRHPGNRTCKECHAVFEVEYKDMTPFCSDICKQAAKSRTRRKARSQGSKGSDRHRKRARRYGVEYEPIRIAKVLERDGWVCGLCTGPISRDAKYPDPMMPSLDHVVPMSLGGPHTYDNVQAAHHRCNTKKSDSVHKEPLYYLDDLLHRAWDAQFKAS